MVARLEEPISLDAELESNGVTFLNDLYLVSKKQQRQENIEEETSEEEPAVIALLSFTSPPPLEVKRDNPTPDGRVGIRFTSKLIVPTDLKDTINKQEKRRRVLKAKNMGRRMDGEEYEESQTLDEVLAEYDRL